MSTLYVTDLDGTLFNSKKQITEYTASVINRCIDQGMLFSVATARMPYGCDTKLEKIKLKTPGILTNGVFLYDFNEKKIISAEAISKKSVAEIIDIFHSFSLSCFLYILGDKGIEIYYGDPDLEKQTQYYSERALQECEIIKFVEDYEDILDRGEAVYLAYTGKKEELEPICRKLENIAGINYSFYLNIYNGLYCLEIFSITASKQNALKKLIEMVGSDEVVVFGDNLNDISMIEIADRSYAPENALTEIKEIVDEVLEDCNHDGVAKFLEKIYRY